MRLLTCLTLCLIAATVHPCFAETYTDKEAGFSYVVPAGWHLVPGAEQTKIAAGPSTTNVNPNINVATIVGREFGMKNYILDVVGNMERGSPKAKKQSEKEFAAGAGLKATKILVTDEMNGKKIRQYCYLFAGNAKSIVVMCTCSEADETAEALFDAAMKTFTILK